MIKKRSFTPSESLSRAAPWRHLPIRLKPAMTGAMPASTQPRYLNSAQRIFFLLLNIGLGILPSLAFFAWVERNASLPWVGIEWGWPWISLQAWPTAALAA